MASINLSGILRDPTGEFSYKNKIRFTHDSNTGQTLKGFRSTHEIEVDGAYDIDVQYGNVSVETWDFLNRMWVAHGTFTINSETPATDIPSLLGITTPATDDDLLVFQSLVADATSAKDDAEAAQVATEALFTGFDSSVADTLSTTLPPEPDVYIPFNDGIEIEKGYGTRNSYGNKSVDFSRASGTGNVNKSNVLETLLDDEPAITSDGLGIYNTYTNSALYSTDASQWVFSGSSSYTTDGTLSQDNTTEMALLSVSAGEFVAPAVQSLGTLTGEKVCFTTEIRKANTDTVRLLAGVTGGSTKVIPTVTFSFAAEDFTSSGTTYSTSVKKINDDHFRVYICVTDNNTGNNSAMFRVLWGLASDLYVSNVGVYINADFEMPVISTNGTAETRAAEVCSIPLMNNMPAALQPFTISVDSDVLVNNSEHPIFSESANLRLAVVPNNNMQFSNAGSTVQYSATTGLKRYCIVFDGSDNKIYEDGELKATIAAPLTYEYNTASLIIFGKRASAYLNSKIKNFKCWHSALTANQVKSLGSAE